MVPLRHICRTNILHFVKNTPEVKCPRAYMRIPHIDKMPPPPQYVAFSTRFQFFTVLSLTSVTIKYQFFTPLTIWYQFFTCVRNWYQCFKRVSFTFDDFIPFLLRCEDLVPSFHICKTLIPILHS